MSNRVLILTGCAGFIGLNVLKKLDKEHLHSKYCHIASIDKMGYATTYNKIEYYKTIESLDINSVEININDLRKNSLYADCEYDVLNFASESHVDNSIKNPFGIFQENTQLITNLIQAFESITSIKNFYQISTDEVFGDLPLNAEESDWFVPTSQFKPSNPYSASKAAQDCLLMSLRHTFGLNVHFIRLANQFGKHQHSEKMLPASVLRVIQGQPIKIYGAGLNRRQWTPVSVSSQIIADIIKDLTQFDTVHIAYKNGVYNNLEIVKIISKILKLQGFKVKKDFIEDRKGHDLMYALKTESWIDEYFKDIDIEHELFKTIQFYIDNKDLYLAK